MLKRTQITPKKPLISKTFVIVFSAVIIFPFAAFGVFAGQCKVRQYTHKANMKEIIDEYQNLKLTSATSDIKKEVQTGGDCVDSNPWISAKQVYSVNTDGTKLLTEFRKNMSVQGYKISNEQFYYSKTCGVKYIANAGNGPLNISFMTADYPLNGRCNTNDEYKFKDPSYFLQSRPTNVYSTLLNQ